MSKNKTFAKFTNIVYSPSDKHKEINGYIIDAITPVVNDLRKYINFNDDEEHVRMAKIAVSVDVETALDSLVYRRILHRYYFEFIDGYNEIKITGVSSFSIQDEKDKQIFTGKIEVL